MRALILLSALIAIALLIPDSVIQTPKPDVLPAIKAPTPESSTFFLTVNVNTSTIHDRLESAIPLTYSGEGHGTAGNAITISYDTKYQINREKINLNFGQNAIAVATHLSGYGNAVAPAHMLRPRISVTMDVDADIGIRSTVELKPAWFISATTTTSLEVTKADTQILQIPVSAIDDVQEALQPKMDDLADKVTKALNAMDVRTPVEKAWKGLGKPIAVDKKKSGWLTIKPSGLYYSGFSHTAEGIRAVIGVDAIIEGSYGSKPADINTGKLPPFQTTTPASSGFNINLPVFASYEYLREPLKKETVGKVYTLDNNAKVEINDANLYGNGENIVVTLDITATSPYQWWSTSGRIYFSGKPAFDATTKHLTMQNFSYDLNTEHYLLDAAEDLFHESLRNKIAKQLRWDFTSKLQTAKSKANQHLAHINLKNGATLQGSVDTMRVRGIYPLATGIQIGTVLKGDVAISF